MSQHHVDAYRQQLLASYYQQQQQLNQTPNYYYNMPSSPVHQAVYSPSPSTMALLSGLQQQHQQEQQQRHLAVASPTPSHLTASHPQSPVQQQQTAPEAPSSLHQDRYYQRNTAASIESRTEKMMDASPIKEKKLKKKKSFLARIAENNKNLRPKDPSFWSPRDAAQAKRFGRGAPKGRVQNQEKETLPTPPPPPPPAQYHEQQSPHTAAAAAAAPPHPPLAPAPAPPSIPAPPFALPQIPAGGYLYYCPPSSQPQVAPAPAPSPPENAETQKPVYRVNATVYNPRQGNPGDRCTIM